jgi:predicted metal-dependent peptidase
VDVSGSVFDKGIQFDFTSIIKSVPKDVADIYIFTFDDGIRSPMMRPENYVPMEGGGGTQPWPDIAALLKQPFYRDADGYLMLTDGAFAAPPPKLIVPSKWCFLMTSEYQKSAIPAGCTILETFVEDPNYIKSQSERGKPKDIFKKAVISTGR